MPASARISARATCHSPETVPFMRVGRSPLCLDIVVDTDDPMPADAELIITAHELFTGQTKVLPGAAPNLHEQLDKGLSLRIAPDDFYLEPGAWHILVDIMRGEKTLAGSYAGSTEVYVHDNSESHQFALACHNIARAEYAFDRDTGTYYGNYREILPGAVDPFSDPDATLFREAFTTNTDLSANDISRGGRGFLMAAHVLRNLGYEQRATYCEEALSRLVRAVAGSFQDDGDAFFDFGNQNEDAEWGEPPGHLLVFLSQVYFHFGHGLREEKDFARYILDQAGRIMRRLLIEFQNGNINRELASPLTGISWYCRAHKAEHGQYFSPEAEDIIVDLSANLGEKALRRGSAINQSVEEHISSAEALLTSRRITRTLAERGRQGAVEVLPDLTSATDALVRLFTGASSDPLPGLLPSQLPMALRGSLYDLCARYCRSEGDDTDLQHFMQGLSATHDGNVTSTFAGLNAAGAMLALSNEYQTTSSPSPPAWWP